MTENTEKKQKQSFFGIIHYYTMSGHIQRYAQNIFNQTINSGFLVKLSLFCQLKAHTNRFRKFNWWQVNDSQAISL